MDDGAPPSTRKALPPTALNAAAGTETLDAL